MFDIDEKKTIHLTRGDIANIRVTANNESHLFLAGDIIRLDVCQKNNCGCVVLRKEVEVDEDTTAVTISLTSQDTMIGEIINRPKDYWYEIELNPDTNKQTIVGYDKGGAKN